MQFHTKGLLRWTVVLFLGLSEVTALAGSNDVVDSAAADKKYFTDLELIDQDGRVHRFYSDLLKDKKVVITFGFVSCKSSCPMVTQNLIKVRQRLAAESKEEVRFLTITVDPVQDTPAVLKSYADRFKTGPNWFLLTGKPENIQEISKRMGSHAPTPEQHKNMLFIGDLRTGHWVKTPSMESPDQIAAAILKLNK
jgi:protein SCO1/2